MPREDRDEADQKQPKNGEETEARVVSAESRVVLDGSVNSSTIHKGMMMEWDWCRRGDSLLWKTWGPEGRYKGFGVCSRDGTVMYTRRLATSVEGRGEGLWVDRVTIVARSFI